MEPKKATQTTGIEWTNHTWNPTIGCTIITAGCTNCYAMRAAQRLMEFGNPSYAGVTQQVNGKAVWTGRVNRATDTQMRKPLGIKTPSLIFVNSMSDFFHESVHDTWRLEALGIMAHTPHQYQVLTKRPEEVCPFLLRSGARLPRNCWIGATVERADVRHRIDTLRHVPATIRFLSIEPLIGAVGELDLGGIHWVIAGGESGPGARPMKFEWLREVIEQCRAQKVATFLKQYGKPENNPLWAQTPAGWRAQDWVRDRDPIGKGGSLYEGRPIKEYPPWQRP